MEQMDELFRVPHGLVEHDHALGVGYHGTAMDGVQQKFHVLGGCHGKTGPFPIPPPCAIEEFRAMLAAQHHMEFIGDQMGSFAAAPVVGDPVDHGVCNHEVMKHLKKAPRQACLKGYVKHSIEELFSLCNVKPEKTFRESLTTKELVVLYQFLENNFDTMEEKEREILSGLLFSCLTGLRYSDICSVEYSNIKRIRNKRWLFLTMKKTSQKVFIPIEQMFSGKALGIIKLFHRTRGKLFHMPSNAICNRVIKRVYKKFFRSRKNISFHLAKHSKNYI